MKRSFFILGFLFLMPLTAHAADFVDVAKNHLNQEAIDYLQESDVIEGYGNGQYKPENRINRAEFIKIIVAAQVASPTGVNCFSDVKQEWFANYVCTAKRMGYIEGYSDGTFRPGNFINFAEASKIITKAMEVDEDFGGTNKEWFAGFIKGLENRHAIPSTVQFFDKEITRGEMAEIVWRLKADRQDKVSMTYKGIAATLPNIESCEMLYEKFKENQVVYYYYGREMEEGTIDVPMDMMDSDDTSAGAPSEASPAKASESAADFSSTNVQVAGVDEADIVKNDGEFVYLVKGDTVRIVKAYPPSKMEEVSNLDFTDDDFTPTEMYVSGDQMVVIGQTYRDYGEERGLIRTFIMPPYPYGGNRTQVFILNIENRSDVTIDREITYDGNYNTSRRIKDDLYLVLNESPNYWYMEDAKQGEDLLPYFQDGDKEPAQVAGCSDIRYFPGHAQPNYMIVSSIPLDDMEAKVSNQVFLGNSENIYASRTHLYVAGTQTNYHRYSDWDWATDKVRTAIFKFSLDAGKVDFVARGSVPGTILNQFSMDSYKDHFRIATNQWDSWPKPMSNNVYVLDKSMVMTGSIEDIAPEEKIYSTRFLGDRLYMVTFRQVDPLFVIDLADPNNPKILGKLKIPGFSNYLHPYDTNHIIGFGKETEVNEWGGTVPTAFKMALFDVSDVKNPTQKFVETIGGVGTDSTLLYNHKALLFDKEKELLAFPIQIAEDYMTTFSGAVVYSLNLEKGFVKKGEITHFTDEDTIKFGDYWPYYHEKNIDRIVYIGSYLYSVSKGTVKANNLSDVKEVGSVDLAE